MTNNLLFYLSLAVAFVSCKKNDVGGTISPATKDSIITTIAGTGNIGFSGDGGLATAAQFGQSNPGRIALDKAGNIYVPDKHRIRKISTNGVITTIAGNDNFGFSGDGGLATAATLFNPNGLAVDADGNLFIADLLNYRIRKINTSGIITTVAGGGNYYAFNGIGGLATSATLGQVSDVVVDAAGNLFFTDQSFHRVGRVDKTTGIMTLVAGNGSQQVSGDGGVAINAGVPYPRGIALDGAGNIFITNGGAIRKVNTTGTISTIAGTGGNTGPNNMYDVYNGVATSVDIRPVGIAFNNIGDLIIADYGNSLVRKLDAAGMITTVAGYERFNNVNDGGKPYLAGFTWPTGVAVDANGNIYIADYGAQRVRKITVK